MIEVGFSESVAGGLQIACRRAGTGDLCRKAEVVVFAGALSEGPLLDQMEGGEARRRVFCRLYRFFPDAFEETAAVYDRAFARIAQAAQQGEAVRVWLMPDDPEDLCGFCCVCRILRDSAAPLSAVLMPRWEETDSALICFRDGGEYGPEKYGELSAQTVLLSSIARRAAADRWDACVLENASLRAVVNGRLTGAPEELYDEALRTSIPEGDFPLAFLLGKALPRAQGAGIRWLLLRVMQMVERGELVRTSPAAGEDLYKMMLRRGKTGKAGG